MAACFQKPEPYANLSELSNHKLCSVPLGSPWECLVPRLFAIRFGSRGLERKVFASYTRTRAQSMKTKNRYNRY